MKRLVIPGLFLLLCVSLGLIAHIANAKVGDLNTVNHTIAVSNVHEIDVQVVDVEVSIGTPTASATFDVPAELMEKIEVWCNKGEFKVKLKEGQNNNNGSRKRGKVRLTVASLDEIDASLGAKVNVLQPVVAAKQVELSATTGASISMVSLSAPSLEVEATTGASITIKGGSVDDAELEATTGASIDCQKVNISDGSATATTGASIRCNISGTRRISTSTGGSVK